MKKLLIASIAAIVGLPAVFAQTFSVNVNPPEVYIETTGEVVVPVVITPSEDFDYQVFLSVEGSNLPPLLNLVFNKATVEPPYSNITLKIKGSAGLAENTYQVIVKGENGPAVSRDTIRVIVGGPACGFRTISLKEYWEPFTDMAIDQNDVKWFSYGTGLLSYDGNGFKSYNADMKLSWVKIDPQNNIWGGSVNGLLYYNRSTYTKYTTENSSLPSNVVYDIAFDDSGNKWIATQNGLARYNGSFWKLFSKDNAPFPTNNVRNVKIDPKGLIWVSVSGRHPDYEQEVYTNDRIFTYDGKSWAEPFNLDECAPRLEPGYPSGYPDNHFVHDIRFDDDGNTWIIRQADKFTIFRYKDGNLEMWGNKLKDVVSHYLKTSDCQEISGDDQSVASYMFMKSMLIARDGRMWFGDNRMGVDGELLLKDGNNWKVFNSGNSDFAGSQILSIEEDKNGKIWMLSETPLYGSSSNSTRALIEYTCNGVVAGVSDVKSETTGKIYPNPTTGEVFVPGSDKLNYNLFNSTGGEVASGKISGNQLNLSELNPGIYLLITNDGTVTRTEKIVKN
jgi:hypothetical protein